MEETLRSAIDYVKESLELLEQEPEGKYTDTYMIMLERVLNDLNFIVSHYGLSKALSEHPEKENQIIDPLTD